MISTQQLIENLRRYDSGEAVCELYEGGLHESAATRIEELTVRIAGLEAEVTRLSSYIEKIEAEIAELSRRFGKHAALCTKCGYYVDAQDANKEAKTRISELEAQLATSETLVATLQEQRYAWEAQQHRIEELESEVTRLRKAIRKHRYKTRFMRSHDLELYAALVHINAAPHPRPK